jgi:hypothetical protein
LSDLNLAHDTTAQVPVFQPSSVRTPFGRLNLILLALLVVQLILVAVVFWPRSAPTGGGPLLADLTAGEVTALRVADAEGQEVSLERGAEGWTLAGTDGFPANSEKITTTLDSLLTLATDRLVTRTAASHRQLQVADDNFVRRITLVAPDGEQVLYLGSSAGAGATHVRIAGDDATYLTGKLSSWEMETTPSSWINTTYFSVPATEVMTMTLTNANGSLTIVRGEDDTWSLVGLAEGETAEATAISSMVNRAATVNLTAPLGTGDDPAYGLAQPQATITLQTRNGAGEEQTHTLLVGASQTEGDGYYFKASNSPYYVTIASFVGNEFVNKQRSDFLAQPEATTDSSAPQAAPGQIPAPDVASDSSDQSAAPEAPAALAPLSPLETPAVSTTVTATAELTTTVVPTTSLED